MKIKDINRFGNQKEYEVVEKIPANYFVWNIGENMEYDDYIPICEMLNESGVNISTLKAIRLNPDEVQKLRKAAGWGVNSLCTAKKALKSKRNGYQSNIKRELAKLTIEIFERITA